MYNYPGVLYRFRGTANNPLSEITNHWAHNPTVGDIQITEDHKVFETTLPDSGAIKNRTVILYDLPDNYQRSLVEHYYLHDGDEVVEEMNVRILNR
ncbi:hypothetical protein Bp8pC_142 [Bacillus phage Bp8p-C]|uniref:Uncharacterized protein n=2 Tax=Agatevirus Bp8pC TaxID=1910937 RepID=A0A0A0PLP7_9CAUD|nr:hypothetical protein AXJ20_gp206 [Bacillus phage Bp8p-C]YP_009784442.1 hypothetical protein QLX39_gp206 [Bacillus phage Bp8p-T]AHJ87572.1 hypothetical protein Bp8pC_142 [Bacillus phage Bp8p-C]AHJ87783.1 hypothetical protein Bp8pT_142 [Bacillus phage Bp8p-T]